MKPCPPGRVPCEVPGCGRTFKTDFEDQRVICGKHYRAIPAWMRRRSTRLRRLYRKWPDFPKADRVGKLANRWWDRCRDRAIEIAMGITA